MPDGAWTEIERIHRDCPNIRVAATIALALVYMVMAAQLESLRDPFIVLFSVPLAAIGGLAFSC